MPPIEFKHHSPENAVRGRSADFAARARTRVPELIDDPRHRIEELEDMFVPSGATAEIGKDLFGGRPTGLRDLRALFGGSGGGERGPSSEGDRDALRRLIGGTGAPGGPGRGFAAERYLGDLAKLFSGSTSEDGKGKGEGEPGPRPEGGPPSGPPKGLIKFKGQDFLPYNRPGHVGPAKHPEPEERKKTEEQKQEWDATEEQSEIDVADSGYNDDDKPKKEDGRPPEDGHRPPEDGHRPAEDGHRRAAPRFHHIRPAEDGTGPVGPRSAVALQRSVSHLAATAAQYNRTVR